MIATSLGSRFDLVLDRSQVHQMLGSMASKAGCDYGQLGCIDRGMYVVVPKGISVS